MQDSAGMRRRNALRDLKSVVDGLAHRHPRAGRFERLAKRLPFNQLGDKKRSAVAIADVVNREEIGMVERTKCPRLLLEPVKALRVVTVRRWE